MTTTDDEKWREWWIFKGTACHGDEKHYDPFADADLKITPEGFYDLVSPQDTIEGGIHVIEHTALDAANAEIARLKSRLSDLIDGPLHTCHDECPRKACVLGRQLAKTEAKLAKAIEALRFYSNEKIYAAYDDFGWGEVSIATDDEGSKARKTLTEIEGL